MNLSIPTLNSVNYQEKKKEPTHHVMQIECPDQASLPSLEQYLHHPSANKYMEQNNSHQHSSFLSKSSMHKGGKKQKEHDGRNFYHFKQSNISMVAAEAQNVQLHKIQ